MAPKAIHAIRSEIYVLADHPESGRPIKGTEYRKWIIPFEKRGYLALYRHDKKAIVILAVRHQLEIDYVL